MKKHKGDYTPEETLRLDEAHRRKHGAFGTSKHRKARIQKFHGKQQKKKWKR